MVGSEYSLDSNYKSSKIIVGAIIKNPKMLRMIPDNFKTKKCKHAITKLSLVIRYVPDQCKTQEMCDKAILENGWTLESIPDCYKNQRICNKASDNYVYALKFVSDCCKTVSWWMRLLLLQYNFPLNAIRLKKICDKAVSEDSFILKYYHNSHKTQKISDEAVVDFLQGLKFLLYWVVTSKIQNFTVLYFQKMIYSFLMKILVILYFLVMKWVFLV